MQKEDKRVSAKGKQVKNQAEAIFFHYKILSSIQNYYYIIQHVVAHLQLEILGVVLITAVNKMTKHDIMNTCFSRKFMQ